MVEEDICKKELWGLMQMAKITSVLQIHQDQFKKKPFKLLFLSEVIIRKWIVFVH